MNWLRSDNVAGVSPEIVQAMAASNTGICSPYGEDELSRRLESRLSDLFERPVLAFPVASGTAANSLGLSAIASAGDLVVCHTEAHARGREGGATEMQSGGAGFMAVPGEHCRIDQGALDSMLGDSLRGRTASGRPKAVSITQLTEAGTLYTAESIAGIGEVARRHGLKVHMDGARFANAVAALDVHPAEITWRANVDVLSFGATKNGTMYADAVVFFDHPLAEQFRSRLKRAGHNLSKSRFMAAQLFQYLEDDLWLRNARHANSAARDIAAALEQVSGATLLHPVDGNMIFVALPPGKAEALAAGGITLRNHSLLPDGRQSFRLVTSFQTSPAEIEAFSKLLETA